MGCWACWRPAALTQQRLGLSSATDSAETWELVTHPGYNDADLAEAHTRLLASRQVEQEALLTLQQFGIELISFADLERDG